MGMVQRCDECGRLGEPGETWVRVEVRPEYIPGNRFADGPMAMEMDCPSPSRYGQTCSARCALERLRKGLLDLETFAVDMGNGIDTLLESRGEVKLSG